MADVVLVMLGGTLLFAVIVFGVLDGLSWLVRAIVEAVRGTF